MLNVVVCPVAFRRPLERVCKRTNEKFFLFTQIDGVQEELITPVRFAASRKSELEVS